MLRTRVLRAQVVTLAIVAGAGAGIADAAEGGRESRQGSSPSADVPAVWPTPQVVQDRPDGFPITPVVGVVAGEGTDPAALEIVEEALQEAGVKRVVRVADDESAPNTPVTVWVGGPSENAGSDEALSSLNVTGPQDLGSDGYVVAAGRDDDDRARVVLAGTDVDGTFYAAQTFRQLVLPRRGADWLPGVEVRDWPSFAMRGGMESFYGPLWSWEDRYRQVDFLAEHKMNYFFYGPADDTHTGPDWDQLYELAELDQFADLVQYARDHHVQFIYRVSPESPIDPSQGICHSDPADLDALVARFEQLREIGVHTFTIAWDDVPGSFQCEQDEQQFGADQNPLAAAQAHVTNYVQEHFIDVHPEVERLITVPTEYAGNASSSYRGRFDELLDPTVLVYWAGPTGSWSFIRVADIQQTQEAFPNHELLIWDNYPVNDYARNRLLLGPLVQREAGLEDHSMGFTANEMNEEEASLIPLFTVADFVWNPQAYDPEESWEASLREFGGDAYEPLRTFAENSRSSTIDLEGESPRLRPLIDDFQATYASGEDIGASGKALAAEFARMAQAPGELRESLDNARFLEQADAYLDKLEIYGSGGRAAIRMLNAHGDDNGQAAWEARLALEEARAGAAEIPQEMAPGIVDPFLTFSARESDGWLGTRWVDDSAEVTGGPPAAPESSLENLVDGDATTAYLAARTPESGESLVMTLAEPRPLSSVVVLQDHQAAAEAEVQARTADGAWVTIGQLDGSYTEATASEVVADAVRLVWADETPGPVVHEVITRYADQLTAELTAPSDLIVPAETTEDIEVELAGIDAGRLKGSLEVDVPDGWTVDAQSQPFDLASQGRIVSTTFDVEVTIPANAAAGSYEVGFVATATDGRQAAASTSVQVVHASDRPYPQMVADAAPEAFWRLGEHDGEALVDASGNNQNGTYQGEVTLGVPGALRGTDTGESNDTAARFAGGYAVVPSSDEVSPSGAYTVEAWVRPSSLRGDPGQAIVEKYSNPAIGGFALRLDGDGRVQAWNLGASSSANVTGTTPLALDSWHHVAVTYDGADLTVYLDGRVEASETTAVAPTPGPATLKIGARGDDAGQRWQGDLDEIALYSHALTAEEIATHYVTGFEE